MRSLGDFFQKTKIWYRYVTRSCTYHISHQTSRCIYLEDNVETKATKHNVSRTLWHVVFEKLKIPTSDEKPLTLNLGSIINLVVLVKVHFLL